MIFISGCKKHAKACITKGTKKNKHESKFLGWHGFRTERSKCIREQTIVVSEGKK